jgi:peptide/nickel transport system substrate-binding protein
MMNPSIGHRFRNDHGILIMKLFPSRVPRLRIAAVITSYLLVAGLMAFAAQPPEVEDSKAKQKKKIGVEDEDSKGTVKKKIVVDDPEPPVRGGPAAPGGSRPDSRLDELDRSAANAKNSAVKKLLAGFIVPFDRITEKGNAVERVKPIPLLWGKDEFPAKQEFPITPLDGTGKELGSRKIAVANVKKIEPFEHIAVAEVEAWLKQKPVGTGPGPDDLTGEEQLSAAEKVLAAVLRFHEYARDNGIRKSKSWDGVHKPLADHLLDVRLKQLQRAKAGQDWQRARQFGTKLMLLYPKDPAVAKEVAVARVAEAELLMKSNKHEDRVKARELLDEFESRFPGAGGEQVRAIRKELNSEAVHLFERAKELQKKGNAVEARNDLDRAEALDPTVPGLRELKREIGSGYPVLYVGVRQWPERMSPATARFDSERQAAELLFEGLLEEVPDGSGGVRYRIGAAASYPLMIPGGRELAIRQTPRSAMGTDGFDAHDVVETIKLLRLRPESPVSASLPWIEGLPTPIGGGGLRINFSHGHPDPRALLTFKILPGRYLAEKGKRMDDPEFAARPFGTGPFRIYALAEIGGNGPRELVFVDNPAYGRARDRVGRPHLREIRFVEAARLLDPLDEFRRGKLHILPDLSQAELKQALDSSGAALGGKGQVITAATNRRIQMLAVNRRRLPLQNLDLRKGISLAIDREEILNELFRVTQQQHRRFTAAMSGPFPPSSWATVKAPDGRPVPLVNRPDATVRLQRYLGIPNVQNEFELIYSTGDPQAQAVCERIKNHVESLFKNSGGKQLTLKLHPLEPRELHRLVFGEHRYDFAYVPYDYSDDWHPIDLAEMLDPSAAIPGGRNFNGFLAPDTNAQEADRILDTELRQLLQFRDFSGQIAPRAVRIHRAFNDCVPFIPLWQLDRHMLVNSSLKVYVDDALEPSPVRVLNPSVLFHNVGRWRLE